MLRKNWLAAIVLLTTIPALTNMATAQGAGAAARHVTLPTAAPTKRVTPDKARVVRKPAAAKPYAKFSATGHASLPAAASATVALSATHQKTGPVALWTTGSGPSSVRVQTLDQKTAVAAGVHGVLFSLTNTDSAHTGSVGVAVDDSTFRNAYGGDYASRLHLVSLPACALTTPAVVACQKQTPVSMALTATVSLKSAMVLAATSDSSGSSGDYTATSLSSGGTWSVSGNTGAFTYSYPVSVPNPVGGAAPDIDLSYNSASQDARTDTTNDQSSWIGDGWESSDNYVERTYKSCSDVSGSGAPTGDGDECWDGQILTMSLNGASTAIVYDDATKTFRASADDATVKIEDLSGASNGTANGEYFRITEAGVQYYFGLNHLPGYASGDDETRSAWTVPIYHAHDGVSACPDGSFAGTACTLGYRFNLDYVVDQHNNATAYYYAPETGYYGADAKNDAVAYVRGGTLSRIDYGLTASTVYSATAPEQVLFSTTERCISGAPAGNTCSDSQFTLDHPEYWPDTPIDLNCASGSTDCAVHGPTFWSRKRLTSILTQIQVGGVTKPVDRYDLDQTFPDGGDHAPTLWLESITRTGLDRLGGAATDTDGGTISFGTPLQLPNRVGTLPGLPLMYHNRIQTVISETGAEVTIGYSTPACSGLPATNTADPQDTDVKAFASTNKTACFPVYWTPEGQPSPLVDWFYTHPVTSVATSDNHDNYQDGSPPELVTNYAYVGNPGWHYDDNEVTKAKYRTWGQFRGYPEVDTTTGDPTVFHYTNGTKVYDQKTLTKTYYFLGMNGDTMPSGTRSAPALTSQDGTVTVADNNALAGQVFETDQYTGVGGTINSATVTVPTIIGPTASRARTGLPALTAQIVRTAKSLNRTAVSYGWRKTETDAFYNTTLGQSTTGMELQSDDRGEAGATGNTAKCTFTRYVDGVNATVVLPAEVISTDQDCSAGGASPSGNLLADTRTSFDSHAFVYNGDGQTSPVLPTTGNPTLVQQASAATGSVGSTFVDESQTTYDSYGRVHSVTRTPHSKAPSGSSLSAVAYTLYSPATGAVPTTVTTIDQATAGASCASVTQSTAACQLSTQTIDPARGLPTGQIDIAAQATSMTYDALGRLTAVWLPNRTKAAQAPANMTFTYALSSTGPSVVTTGKLLDDGTYSSSEVLYDAMLRGLETQTTGENGSTTVSDTQYDSHGWTVLTNNGYSVAGSPVSTLISDHQSQVSIPDTTVTDHDALGRATLATEEHDGAQTWSTRTAYAGDSTTVIPPSGGVATRTTVDARGHTTRLDQYTAVPTLSGSALTGYTASGGTAQATTYAFTAAGQQSTVTGPDGAVWTYGYDLQGRTTSTADPDTGTTTSAYDDAGNLSSTVDSRGKELDYTYDLLGRKLTETDAGFKAAAWTYDTLRIGQPTSSTRYVSGVAGGYTEAVTGYTDLDNPTGTTITLPDAEKPLPASYTTSYAYSTDTETLTSQTDPRATGLAGETITYDHDALGAPTETSGTDLYVANAVYTDFGSYAQVDQGASTNLLRTEFGYDAQTLRPTERSVFRTQAPGPEIDDTTYAYDAAGDPLSIVDQQGESGSTVTDAQCFQYDALNRLTQAWTSASATSCTAGSVSTGAGAYWQSYAYSAIGDRTQVVDHSTSGGSATTTTYHNACDTSCGSTSQPHTLTSTTGGATPTSFVYDADGNLLSRTTAGGSGQTLKWDDEGHLSEVDTAAGNTKYVYDADGNQLIRRDPGRTTLFAGDTQLVVDTTVTPNALIGAVRTYSNGGSGQAVAVRSSLGDGGVDYLLEDPNGTSTIAVDTTTQVAARQEYTPYGDTRGSGNTTAWPDLTHGYLGAAKDTGTGYTDLGARKYDPGLGRFISVDPLLETTSANQMGGYTYAADNPVASSDPDGTSCLWGDGAQFAGSCDPTVAPEKNSQKGSSGSSSGSGSGGGGSDVSTVLKKPAPLGGLTLNALRSRGYKGSANYTYADALQFASLSEDAYTIVCLHTFGKSEGDCQKNDPWTKPQADGKVTWKSVLGGVLELAVGAAVIACAVFWEVCVPAMATGTANFLMYGGGGGDDGAATGLIDELFPATDDATADAVSNSLLGDSCDSFTPDTPVLMADGTTKQLKDVKLGDVVLATDPDTGRTQPEKVTTLHDDLDHAFTDVTVEDAAGHVATVHTTAGHPFWDDSSQAWVAAAQLPAGDFLIGADGSRVRVDGVLDLPGRRHMLNLTVDNLHTYYVIAGSASVLVHNAVVGACPVDGTPHGAMGEAATKARLNSEGYTKITSQVRFINSKGKVFIADFVAKNKAGQWVAIEAKTGKGATITPGQAVGYPELETRGAIVNSSKLEGYSIPKGSTVTMGVEFDLWSCPICGSTP